ncbi:hypothetical protein HK104_001039 [Borealophlyctis nickersoniae]|nr:hypothetical protein HK104_001039 [Borealophlyctis nickersoniae]
MEGTFKRSWKPMKRGPRRGGNTTANTFQTRRALYPTPHAAQTRRASSDSDDDDDDSDEDSSPDDYYLEPNDIIAVLPDPTQSHNAYWLAKVLQPIAKSRRGPQCKIPVRWLERCADPRPGKGGGRGEGGVTAFKEGGEENEQYVFVASVLADEEGFVVTVEFEEKERVGDVYLVDEKVDGELKGLAERARRKRRKELAERRR